MGELVAHPRVLKVVALSGGYSRDEANTRLARQKGMIASFSRALTEGLTAQQSEAEFNAALDRSIEGIYQAVRREQANGQIINIGSTEEVTILELARRIQRLCGAEGDTGIEFVPYESFTGKGYQDVMRRVPDVGRCKALLGVEARVPLDDGLARTIAWQRLVPRAQA